MWPVALVALFTAGPFGVVLFLAALATQAIKVAKVDAQYAKQGKTPPSHALISKWLDSRTAKGGKAQKPAKYGAWRYAWQRWQAMWQDLAERHKEVRGQYKTAVAQAKARGEQPPPKPTFKETLKGWKWHLDQLTPPAPVADGQPGQAAPNPTGPAVGPAGPDGAPKPSPRLSTAPTTKPDGTVTPGMGWPTTGVCAQCGTRGNLTAVGRCEPCVRAGEHGFCSRCNGLMYRDGDVFRHGPHQGCDAVAPLANKVPPPAATRRPSPSRPAVAATEPPNQQGDTMTQPTTQPTTQQSGEVVGLMSAINYATAVAAAHDAHSQGGGEQYLASLGQAEVGPDTIRTAAHAQEMTQIAAAAWHAHERKLKEQLAAKEVTTAETGKKDFLLSE